MPRQKYSVEITQQVSACPFEEAVTAAAIVSNLLIRAERRRQREQRLAAMIQKALYLAADQSLEMCSQT